MTGNDPNLDIANLNAYIKFGEIYPSPDINEILISIKANNSIYKFEKSDR